MHRSDYDDCLTLGAGPGVSLLGAALRQAIIDKTEAFISIDCSGKHYYKFVVDRSVDRDNCVCRIYTDCFNPSLLYITERYNGACYYYSLYKDNHCFINSYRVSCADLSRDPDYQFKTLADSVFGFISSVTKSRAFGG